MDRPPEVRETDWQTRRQVWDRLIPHVGDPVLPALRWTLFGRYDVLTARAPFPRVRRALKLWPAAR